MSAERLLGEVDRLLRVEVPGTAGLWPRACVWLLRQALETSLGGLWARTRPELRGVSTRAQLLVLPTVVDAAIAGRAAHLWSTQSNASHHHAYDLAPTAAELRGWHGEVSAVVAALSPAPDRPDRAAGGRPDGRSDID